MAATVDLKHESQKFQNTTALDEDFCHELLQREGELFSQGMRP